ncbi:orotate phosphoribosyltransferase [bacterium]|jgi:orotate phosphoribosyltransferase|nr:orotate phosphoribosyltransferase [bacterium]
MNTQKTPNKTLLKKIKDLAYLKGDFTTRAGKKTSYYIDKYLFETDPAALELLSEELVQLFPDPSTYDRIAAPELGAVPIAAVVSIKLNKPFIIVKKQQKDYGTQKDIEGSYNKGEKMVLLEDILTTGGTAIKSAKILNKLGITVTEVIGVIDREEGALENFKNENLPVKALLSKTDLESI